MLTWLLSLLFLDHAKLFLRTGLLWGDQVTPLRGVRPMPGASTVHAGCPHWPQWHGACPPAPCDPCSSGSQMRPLVPCAGEGVCGNIKTSKHVNFLPTAGGTAGVSPQWCLFWERAETCTPQKGPSCCRAEPSYRNNPSCCVCFWTPTRSLFEALCTTAHGNCHALYSVNPAFEFGPGW